MVTNCLLYLDFDWALHHEDVRRGADGPVVREGRLFEHAPKLAELLEPYPKAGIVLSATSRPHLMLSHPDGELVTRPSQMSWLRYWLFALGPGDAGRHQT